MEIINKIEFYQSRLDTFTKEKDILKKRFTTLAILRLIFFVGSFAVLFIFLPNHVSLAIVGFIISLVIFIFLVKYYLKVSHRHKFIEKIISLNTAEINALKGDWSFFDSGANYLNSRHPYSADLDLFGNKSLFQYLNRTCSPNGREFLANWLTNPERNIDLIKSRQEAIKELSQKLEWRQTFFAIGLSATETKEEIDHLIKWSKTKMVLKNGLGFKFFSYLLPVFSILVLVFTISGIFPEPFIAMAIIANLFLLSTVIRKLNLYFNLISKKVSILKKYAKLIELIENEEFNAPYLQHLKSKLLSKGLKASKIIQQLYKLLVMFEYRLNMLLGLILNAFLVWDIHIVNQIEKWRAKNHENLFSWLKVLDEFEALNSLATYAYNNTDFIYPTCINDEFKFSANELGHPLIDESVRVNNDIEINGLSKYFVVTGGNMAGKSTFLRTVGINLVLAMNGAPVCATKFEFKPIDIYSSMRTNDSLAHNESYFFAEISKLKSVIERLKEDIEVFVLLDEILKGTNSTDQQIGSKAFLMQLMNHKGAGLIATHDLSLGNLAKEYPESFSNKCFEVSVNKDKLVFDYKLIDGVAQNLNASFLMKQMGIVLE